MKPSAYLINVARGAMVDEAALIDALRAGEIAGAALDVFATEPLPSTSPLWDRPNVLLTPHVAGDYRGHRDEVLRCLSNNLERYLQGQALQHQVDKARGY
jgi:phosphoglycerate dehydrogenase-like enzyme